MHIPNAISKSPIAMRCRIILRFINVILSFCKLVHPNINLLLTANVRNAREKQRSAFDVVYTDAVHIPEERSVDDHVDLTIVHSDVNAFHV